MSARALVVAKAPVPGLAKTRLGAVIGMDAAADLAAAALLDTLDVCRQAFGDRCHLALAGNLGAAARGAEILDALEDWQVFAQYGDSFGQRLAHAHGAVAGLRDGGVVQVGMDTPQITPDLLRTTATLLDEGADIVIGPAVDGGWWVLGLADGARATALVEVAMSTPDTYADTVGALTEHGGSLVSVGLLRDVDTVDDAALVASLAPGTRFARAWAAISLQAS